MASKGDGLLDFRHEHDLFDHAHASAGKAYAQQDFSY